MELVRNALPLTLANELLQVRLRLLVALCFKMLRCCEDITASL